MYERSVPRQTSCYVLMVILCTDGNSMPIKEATASNHRQYDVEKIETKIETIYLNL